MLLWWVPESLDLAFCPKSGREVQNAHGPPYRDLGFSGSSAPLGALLVDGDPEEAVGPGVSYRLTY